MGRNEVESRKTKKKSTEKHLFFENINTIDNLLEKLIEK